MVGSKIGMSDLKDRYPREAEIKTGKVTLTILDDPTSEALATFSQGLNEEDLLFLSRDLREPKVLEAWKRDMERGNIFSVMASQDGKVLGTTAVLLDKQSWSAHVGELRILVLPEARNTGLGRILIQESFLMGLGLRLEKLTARMMLDQEGAINVFEEMGFKKEAMLLDHVKDSQGKKHDLLMLSHDVMSFDSLRQAYGIDEEAFAAG
jgi:GNAT superfamily N-acetyltransferase